MVAVIAIVGWLVLVLVCAQYTRKAGHAALALPAVLGGVWLLAAVAAAGARFGWNLVQ